MIHPLDLAVIQRQIARGVRFFDSEWPGWERRIDLDLFAMESCFDCLLGQLGGDFIDALCRLVGPADGVEDPAGTLQRRKALRWARLHGLQLGKRYSEGRPDTVGEAALVSANWKRLTNLWRAEIRRKLSSGVLLDLHQIAQENLRLTGRELREDLTT